MNCFVTIIGYHALSPLSIFLAAILAATLAVILPAVLAAILPATLAAILPAVLPADLPATLPADLAAALPAILPAVLAAAKFWDLYSKCGIYPAFFPKFIQALVSCVPYNPMEKLSFFRTKLWAKRLAFVPIRGYIV